MSRPFILLSLLILIAIIGISQFIILTAAQTPLNRPSFLDNLTMSPRVVEMLDIHEMMSMINTAYKYCSQFGNLVGSDADKCRDFMNRLDQSLIDMLTNSNLE
jgi:putative hemolysin